MESSEPSAAPRTPREAMFALREAGAEGLWSQVGVSGERLKPEVKDLRVMEAEKPPSS
jgi:hypothetical protein